MECKWNAEGGNLRRLLRSQGRRYRPVAPLKNSGVPAMLQPCGGHFMQHVPNGSQMRVRIGEPPHGGCTVDDCIACHARRAYNLLLGIVEILRPIAIWRRHSCKAASVC